MLQFYGNPGTVPQSTIAASDVDFDNVKVW